MSCSPKPDAPADACGCCEGVEASTPREVGNRPGLPAIHYRIGAYGDFKRSLLAGLSSSRYPALVGLRTRGSDDYTIALLDAVACAADVLSFYQERLATESYLRTATERVSLQEMGKLIGYRLRPGSAAETWLAFALEAPRLPPANLPPEPGSFVTGIPAELQLLPGLKVQSVPGPDEKPQIFETVEPLTARPEWTVMPVLPDHEVWPGLGATHTWLAGVDTQLKPGDALLLVASEFRGHPTNPRWDMRFVTAVAPDMQARRTRVEWREPIDSLVASPAVPPEVHALRQRAAIFGHNAPDWPGLTDEFKASYLGLEQPEQLRQSQRTEWPQFDLHGPGGSGLISYAQVAPMEAAEALRTTLKAEGVAEVRRGLAAVGTLATSAGALLEKAAALPGEVGKGAVQAAALVPGAVGQVAEVVMAPIRWLTQDGLGRITDWIGQAQNSSSSAAGVINAIAGVLSVLTGGGFNAAGGLPGLPGGLPMPPMPALLSQGDELRKLVETLLGKFDANGNILNKGALQFIEGKLDELLDSAEATRSAGAGVIGAALSATAGAAYAALIEAQLNVSPRLPYATALTVCDDSEATSVRAMAALPDFVVAMALSDPRPALVMIAAMAELDASFWPRNLSAQTASDSASRALRAITSGSLTAPVEVGEASRQLLDSLASGNAAAPLRTAITRMRAAAAQGVRRAHQALLKRADELRVEPEARRFIGHLPDTVSLDRAYPAVLAGSYVVLRTPQRIQLFEVKAVEETSRSEFAVAGKSTVLRVPPALLGGFATAVRETTVFVQSEPLPLARTPLTQPVDGAVVEVAGPVRGLLKDRRVIVQGLAAQTGERVAHPARLLEDATVQADRTRLHIQPALPLALQRTGTVVFGNVAPASHGETVAQILGAGDASQPFQRFELKRLPLTWRGAVNELGADSEITVRVGDVAWAEKNTLFGATPDERAYHLSTDEQGREWVRFGDGVRGARLPGGVNNVRASYRQGIGRAGNVPADRLTQLMSRPLGLKSVSNPAAALGGNDPEAAAQARRSMPMGTRTLGRAVSLRDYEDFALAFTGIAKARARMLALPAGPSVVLAIAGQGGEALPETHPTRQLLLAALKESGDPHVRLVLQSYRESRFRIGLKVRRDPAYEAAPLLAAVEAALRAHFSFDMRELEQPVLQSEVVAVVHGVPGVVAMDLDLLYGGSWSPQQMQPAAHHRLLAQPLRLQGGSAQPPELLTLAPQAFDRLQEM